MPKTNRILLIIFIVFTSFHLLGYLFPATWWSTHYFFLLDSSQWISFIAVSIACVFLVYKQPYATLFSNKKLLGSVIITGIFMLCFAAFPIATDYYGDAYKMHTFLTKIPNAIPQDAHDNFFQFSLDPWAGQNTTYSLITYIAYYFNVTYKTAYYIFNTIFGGAFVFTWIYFILNYIEDKGWQFILIFSGLTAPFLLNFFGHFEVYSIVLFLTLLWMILALYQLKNKSKLHLGLLFLLLLLCVKFHAISLLLFPVWFALIWIQYTPNTFTWKRLLTFMITPIYIAGALLYFFYFKDHNDTRSLHNNTAMAFDHVFLPLLPPEAPLDNYHVLSTAHIFDFFTEGLVWSTAALFTICCLFFIYRKKLQLNTSGFKIAILALLLYASIFFMINPLLSMPMDWDLFSIPAPLLLIVLVVLIKPISQNINAKPFIFPVLIIGLLNLPVIITHTSNKSIALRLEQLSIRIYNTYYEWSALNLDRAMRLDNPMNSKREQRFKEVVQQMQPYTRLEIDREFAKILIDQGRYHLRTTHHYTKALPLFETSKKHFNNPNASLLSIEAHFYLSNYDAAYAIAKSLITTSYPTTDKAIRIGIHCALEAQQYEDALLLCKRYLTHVPNDTTITTIKHRLAHNDDIAALKSFFRRRKH